MSNLNKKILFSKSLFASCLILFVFFTASKVDAASLYFSPASGSYNVGDTIRASVLVDAKSTPINSVESNIIFPKDLLSVTSVSKSNSIFTFWVQEPTFSNADGVISLSGGLPTPGYGGSSGRVLDVFFRVKKAGTASVKFTSATVLANDGLGTNVLQDISQAVFTLNPGATPVQAPVTAPVQLPIQAPVQTTSAPINKVAFNVKEIVRADATYPQAKFLITTKGDVSLIDHFEFQISGKKSEAWKDDGTHIYETPVLAPGSYTLTANIFDKDGNSASSSLNDFTIDPLNAPIITDYSKELLSADTFTIRGLSYPSSQVQIYLQRNGEDARNFLVDTDSNGAFVYNTKLSSGSYQFYVNAINDRGARSLDGEKYSVLVTALPFVALGSWKVNLIYVLIPVIILFIILILLVIYFWYKFKEEEDIVKQYEKEGDIRVKLLGEGDKTH